jgi:catechol 2,3-dioxygenase-like lactoylglutathione lyase family enzyme
LRARILTAVLAVTASLLPAAEPVAVRPRIVGLSHVSLRVSDLGRSRAFYEDFLGYTTGPAKGGLGLLVAVSDRQYIELQAGLEPDQDRLDHVAVQTDDVEAMRRYLSSRGITGSAVVREGGGNRAFTVTDPDGNRLEVMEQVGDGWPLRAPVPPAPLSRRILHAGIVVADLAAARRFFGEALGFEETWRGSRGGSELSWTNMKVPEGDDYLEFMLFGTRPAPRDRGTPHHICLEVPDVEDARARLLKRPHAAKYRRPLEVRVGVNRRRQLNLYDPDGTRVELMEPRTVDGQPVPSSSAPPPRR